MEHKFNVGNKVVIKPYDEVEEHFCITRDVWEKARCKSHVITRITYSSCVGECANFDSELRWPLSALEPAENSERRVIVIHSNGRDTIAIEKLNGKEIRRAVAKCSPDDEYKWETGRDLAFERLTEKNVGYNGRVVCVCANGTMFKTGKLYEFIDGKIEENGVKYPAFEKIESFEDWRRISAGKWLEIVE